MGRPPKDRRQSPWPTSVRHELEVLSQDLRYSVRVIRRTGPLSIALVLILIAGLGTNSVVFSLFNGLLFRPSATRDPDSFVQIYAQLSGKWHRESHGPDSLVTLEDTMCDAHVVRGDSVALDFRDARQRRWCPVTRQVCVLQFPLVASGTGPGLTRIARRRLFSARS
jgi:hypothetical protein